MLPFKLMHVVGLKLENGIDGSLIDTSKLYLVVYIYSLYLVVEKAVIFNPWDVSIQLSDYFHDNSYILTIIRCSVQFITDNVDKDGLSLQLISIELSKNNNKKLLMEKDKLCKTMKPYPPLLVHLESTLCIDGKEKEKIEDFGTDYEKNSCLIDLMARKGHIGIERFLHCLVQTQQQHIVEYLKESIGKIVFLG